MRARAWTVLCAAVLAACGAARDDASIDRDVRAFLSTVAHDIARDGPTAWHRFFPGTPNFFMASDGQLAFADGATAAKAIDALPQMIQTITLDWSDIRIDPLGPGMASVGARFHELRTAPNGARTDESGYFTAVAEVRDGHWQFRNAHWSTKP